ncbi:HEAT repeat domain-containing protein [Spirulina major CS-329]|uniref:HEAT repeat domain-containing protein n=1 Tax=Spirulina TaxID=1154 RepID=UPI00232BB83B|nr:MULTISPECIES: HEAT repeat domain-containing protein [Spirulina]MDB9494688.1 HEAT repeat domain-containing protein [Spirulina subsalsa CS-330]MDB9502737.1 HEAT repeat domain-containing protein [Spirulina major CS-329]
MSHSLTAATQCAQLGKWSAVCQHLRQWFTIAPVAPPDEERHALDLALLVLAWGDFQERWDVAKLLPRFGMGAIAALLAILTDDTRDLEERWFTGRILGEFPEPQVITTLIDVLQTSEDDELRLVVAGALAQIGQPAIVALAQTLDQPTARPVAVRSLAQIHHPAVIDPLLTVAQDADPTVRQAAIEALSGFQDVRIGPLLQQAVRDPVAAVRREALMGLGLRVTQIGEQAVLATVCPCLDDWHLEVCQQAALTLGRLGSPAAVQAIARVLERTTTPAPLQQDLIRALGWTATPESLAVLQALLPRLPMGLGVEAIHIVGRIERESLRPAGATLLLNYYRQYHDRNLDYRLKQALTQAWGQLGDPIAIDALVQLMGDVDHRVRLHAIAALKRFDLPA